MRDIPSVMETVNRQRVTSVTTREIEMQQQEMKLSSRTFLKDIPTVIEIEDPRGNSAVNSSETETERQERETTIVPLTEIQRQPPLEGGSSESDAKALSESLSKIKHYSKKFSRSFFYEMYWKAWFLLFFCVFQPNCKLCYTV